MAIAEQLPLAVVGCDFRLAPSRVRSALVLPEERVGELFCQLVAEQAADGFVVLNTCNRNEWLVSTPQPAWTAELLRSQMVELAGPGAAAWFRPYVFTGQEAARHVFRVAIGQESLVVGERQIAGQLYAALEKARQRRTSSRVLNGLGSIAGRLVRIALRRGCIRSAAVGVHSLALEYLRYHLDLDERPPVAVVGTGRIGRRVLGVMNGALGMDPLRVNRTLPADGQERWLSLSRLPEALRQVRAAVVCTGALEPVVRAEHFSAGRDRPLLVVDIGIPEQVERRGLPAEVQVVGLDDLVDFHRRQTGEQGPSPEARQLVDRAVEEFASYCQEQAYTGVLDTIQRHHRQLVGEEIPRLVNRRFGDLDERLRYRLQEEFRNIVLEYTGEVFRTVKETLLREPDAVNNGTACREDG
ncbi:MAG: hypothetical protein DRI34_01970 [Deltaproteobacteria bacterium]|nr:MAG: hypothetical protein DRI34_01970 [Deltaproteobacteria bacterium]